jgi:hypothetical protein
VINVVVAPAENLNYTQLQDENLKWLYDLKIQARADNKQHLTITTFNNQEQRSLYNQWSRIQIINDTLYREYTVSKTGDHTVNKLCC